MIEDDKKNFNENNPWWKPAMFFYAKVTSWIIIPLVLAILLGKYVTKTIGSQSLFFIFVMLGFGISCFGIYREVKNYQKGLDNDKKDGK